MGKYTSIKRAPIPRPVGPHPVWRGIGCVMALIIPILSYVGGRLTVETGLADGWSIIPYQLLGNVTPAAALWKIDSLVPLLGFIQAQQNLYAILIFALLYLVVLTAVVVVIYALSLIHI